MEVSIHKLKGRPTELLIFTTKYKQENAENNPFNDLLNASSDLMKLYTDQLYSNKFHPSVENIKKKYPSRNQLEKKLLSEGYFIFS